MNAVDNLIDNDIAFVKRILPKHYQIKESAKKGSIHCSSEIGIRQPPYTRIIREPEPSPTPLKMYKQRTIVVDDAEDEEHWQYIFKAIKNHFGERFQEVYHNTCFCHVDFTIYLKP